MTSVGEGNAQLTCHAVWTHPSIQTHLGPRRLTAIVAKVVVPRNTQLIAFVSVVVLVAAHPDAVLEASHRPVVHDGLPVVTRVDHPRVNDALDEKLLSICKKQKKVKEKGPVQTGDLLSSPLFGKSS